MIRLVEISVPVDLIL